MPGLGTSFGRGGATTFLMDLQNADCILIEGSNFAEAHPVGFRFVMKAKERGATIIHVDPRYTRTSAMADVYAPIRSGTDIVFLGGIINWVLQNGREFREYVVAYTNAARIVREDFADTEDLGGLFSGYDEQTRSYDASSWQFEPGPGDPTLEHPRCVFQILKRHFSRYTPEMVEEACGTPRELFLRICELLAANSGRERTTAFAYAVGWTQHTIGVQYIRTAAILQLLLGNVGRPGGGIMALRGHANIQGATDIATLYDLLPGYLPMPSALRDEQTLAEYIRRNTKASGWWANFPKYIVSLLKAWYGSAASADNDYCYAYLPQLIGDHSTLPTQMAMKDGVVKGYVVLGQNPAASGLNAEHARAALGELEWLVNVDAYETETASFWRREGVDPRSVKTEVFFIPAATVIEKEGTMTNTNRLLQWHDKVVDPAGDSVSDLMCIHQLGLRLKRLYAASQDAKDRPLLDLTWNYEHDDPHERARGEPSALKVLQEINGYRVADGELVGGFTELRDDGSTASGGWIYSGVCPDRETNRARNRKGDDWTALDWGFAWPANRRMLYNRASADPEGKPWSERKRYVWWDAGAENPGAPPGRWVGVDVPDFPATKPPAQAAQPHTGGMDALSGADPFIMLPDGRGALFVTGALTDGPLPAHYEPLESTLRNPLYRQQSNPALREWRRRDNPLADSPDPRFPYVLTTYRLTEHSGVMTRWVPWLAELQPHLFCEIGPELAVERGIRNGDWCTIRTARGEIEARALVSGRMSPLRVAKGRWLHQIGLPYNYGPLGLATGDSAGDLVALAMDPNVSIHEAKTLTCDIRPGRRSYRAISLLDLPVPLQERSEAGQPTIHGVDQ